MVGRLAILGLAGVSGGATESELARLLAILGWGDAPSAKGKAAALTTRSCSASFSCCNALRSSISSRAHLPYRAGQGEAVRAVRQGR